MGVQIAVCWMSVPEHGYAPQWRVSCSSFSDLGLPLALVHPAVRVYVLAVTATGHFTHNWLLLYNNCGVQVLMSPLPWVNNFQNNLDMHVDIRALKKNLPLESGTLALLLRGLSEE